MNQSNSSSPTVTSNGEAARIACMNERRRVVDLLALAEPPVPNQILAAIENGTPAAIFETNRNVASARAAGAPSADAAPARSGVWSDVVAKQNEKTRQAHAAPAAAPATSAEAES